MAIGINNMKNFITNLDIFYNYNTENSQYLLSTSGMTLKIANMTILLMVFQNPLN